MASALANKAVTGSSYVLPSMTSSMASAMANNAVTGFGSTMKIPKEAAALGNTDRSYTGDVYNIVDDLSPASNNVNLPLGVAPNYEYKQKNKWMEG